jgi:hypothetical protein
VEFKMSEEEKLNEKWSIHDVVQQAIKSSHSEPSPETRERLATLETNQKNFMDKLDGYQEVNEKAHGAIMESLQEFHKTTNASLEKLDIKLDNAINTKAEKTDLARVESKADSLLIWKAGIVGMGIVVLFIIYTLKDYLLGKL